MIRNYPAFTVTKNGYFRYDPLDVDLYLEESRETDGEGQNWNIGAHDTTVGSSPTIPDSLSSHPTREDAICGLLRLSMDLGAIVRSWRESETYQKAIQVAERAPEWSEGNVDDKLPAYRVRQEQTGVIGGRKSVNEAVSDLYDEAE